MRINVSAILIWQICPLHYLRARPSIYGIWIAQAFSRSACQLHGKKESIGFKKMSSRIVQTEASSGRQKKAKRLQESVKKPDLYFPGNMK
jgi:hypothetical protein